MKKLLKSKKALSPVVAAIILIAVTVAVSIAVAAWMGSLTFTFMETEEMTITRVNFVTALDGLNVTCVNTGTADVTISAATVTGEGVTGTSCTFSSSTTVASDGAEYELDINLGGTAISGNTYLLELISSKGNKYTYTVIAP
jgi:flagellin-like protein